MRDRDLYAIFKNRGGGTGGVSSWNDLTDKPFGEIRVVALGNTTLTTEESSEVVSVFSFRFDRMPIDGNCEVTLNGTKHETKMATMTLMGDTITFYGDFAHMMALMQEISIEEVEAQFGIKSTGEPFGGIVEVEDGIASSYIAMFSDVPELTISIVCNGFEKIQNEYLPTLEEQLQYLEYSNTVTFDGTTDGKETLVAGVGANGQEVVYVKEIDEVSKVTGSDLLGAKFITLKDAETGEELDYTMDKYWIFDNSEYGINVIVGKMPMLGDIPIFVVVKDESFNYDGLTIPRGFWVIGGVVGRIEALSDCFGVTRYKELPKECIPMSVSGEVITGEIHFENLGLDKVDDYGEYFLDLEADKINEFVEMAKNGLVRVRFNMDRDPYMMIVSTLCSFVHYGNRFNYQATFLSQDDDGVHLIAIIIDYENNKVGVKVSKLTT